MRLAPSRRSSALVAVSRIRDRRPIRSPSSQFSRALRTTAWRAADGVKPRSFRLPISASCHAPSGRGSRNSPRMVSSVERAAGAPTDRRLRTSSTARNLSCAAMVLAGGTVADVYTGTWIEANVEVEDGRITYVGPREPRGDVIDVTRQGHRPGLHRAAHAPVVPVLAVVAARGRGARRHDDARLRQPLLLPLARGRRPAPDRRRHERRAGARVLGGAARPADGLSAGAVPG